REVRSTYLRVYPVRAIQTLYVTQSSPTLRTLVPNIESTGEHNYLPKGVRMHPAVPGPAHGDTDSTLCFPTQRALSSGQGQKGRIPWGAPPQLPCRSVSRHS